MDANIKKANKVKFEYIMKNLEKRQITCDYCDNMAEAAEKALGFVSDGDKVSWGGSVTIDELGIKAKLGTIGAVVIDPFAETDPEKAYDQRASTLLSDVYFMSTNAITMDGKLVNIDGSGNRMAALCFGPKKVVVVAGANKIVASEEEAVSRIKTDACPPNCIRLGKETPCALTGKCGECLKPGHTVCSMTVTTRFCSTGRIHVLLVNENLGY